MRPFRTLWLLTLLAVLLSSMAAPASASWSCDGRTCSTDLVCCCLAPPGTRDRNCQAPDRSNSGTTSSACPASCNCVQNVVTGDCARPVSPLAISVPVWVPVLLPRALPTLAGLPSERLARSTEDRGPPTLAGCLATPALRGPPCLTPHLIGT